MQEGQPKKALEDKDDPETPECGSGQLVTSGSKLYSSSESAAFQLKSRHEALALNEKEPTTEARETKLCTPRVEGLRPLPSKDSNKLW